MKIMIYGAGKSLAPILDAIIDKSIIQACLDNNESKWGTYIDGIETVTPYNINQYKFDYVVVAAVHTKTIIEQLHLLGVKTNQIILFYDENIKFSDFKDIFHEDKANMNSCMTRIKVQWEEYQKKQDAAMTNLEYEIADKIMRKQYSFPNIASIEATIKKIITDKVSVSRYGDGEFQIIEGHAKDIYQNDNKELADRLKEVLNSELPNHIVALADDYGCLNGKSDSIKYITRRYMTAEKREFIISLLKMNKQYYNAYISRPYSIYDDDEAKKTSSRFQDLKRIWNNRDIVIIEGDKTRSGVGNDLFENAKSIQRIIAPNENAFDKYADILKEALKLSVHQLALIALGPTATILAYDLSKAGIQAIDIGHLDIEYEWYNRGVGQTYVPNKYNNEVVGDLTVTPLDDKEYENQIISIIHN